MHVEHHPSHLIFCTSSPDGGKDFLKGEMGKCLGPKPQSSKDLHRFIKTFKEKARVQELRSKGKRTLSQECCRGRGIGGKGKETEETFPDGKKKEDWLTGVKGVGRSKNLHERGKGLVCIFRIEKTLPAPSKMLSKVEDILFIFGKGWGSTVKTSSN